MKVSVTALVLGFVLLLAACEQETSTQPDPVELGTGAEDASEGTAAPGTEPAETEQPGTEQPETEQPGTEQPMPGATGAALDATSTLTAVEARDGVWTLGPAGEVEIRATDGGVELVAVRPATGWDVVGEEADDDEVEVRLRQGAVEWELDAEVDDGRLEVEIHQRIEGAEPGAYTVGDAGVVEFADDGARLSLVDATAADGWEAVVEQESDDEIEVDLVREGARWQVEIERDGGRVDVELHLTVR